MKSLKGVLLRYCWRLLSDKWNRFHSRYKIKSESGIYIVFSHHRTLTGKVERFRHIIRFVNHIICQLSNYLCPAWCLRFYEISTLAFCSVIIHIFCNISIFHKASTLVMILKHASPCMVLQSGNRTKMFNGPKRNKETLQGPWIHYSFVVHN